jgi:hypothetical protein
MTPAPAGRTVQFEGKTHQFPADATDDEIRQALDSSSASSNPQFQKNQQIIANREAQQPQGSALSRFGKGLYDSTIGAIPETLKTIGSVPLSILPGETGAAARETLNRNIVQPQANQFRAIRAMGPVSMKDVPEIAGRTLAGVLPMAGPMAAGIGEKAGSGDLAGAAGTAVGVALPAAAAEVPVSRLRSPITMGEARLPSKIGGIPIQVGPGMALPYAAARAVSGMRLRSPLEPLPAPPTGSFTGSRFQLTAPHQLFPEAPPEPPPDYLPATGPEPPAPITRNPPWRGISPPEAKVPEQPVAPSVPPSLPSGRVPGTGTPKPIGPAESYEPPYLPARGPAPDDFVPPYLDPHGPFSEAASGAAPAIVPPSKPTAKGLAPSDIAAQLKSEMESSGTLPKGKGLTPPPADAQPAIVTGQRLARSATSAGIAGDLKAQGMTADKLPASDDVGGWQKLFDANGSPFRKTPEAQRKMIDAVISEFGKQ